MFVSWFQRAGLLKTKGAGVIYFNHSRFIRCRIKGVRPTAVPLTPGQGQSKLRRYVFIRFAFFKKFSHATFSKQVRL